MTRCTIPLEREEKMTIEWSGEEILQMAVQIEKNGMAFYQGLAESAMDDDMRNLMEFLAEEEKKHLATFQSFSGVLNTAALTTEYELKYAEEGSLYLKALADSKIFADANEAAQWAKEARSPSEALSTAIGLEKDSILFYQEMRHVVHQEDRDRIDRIIAEEKKHIQTLVKLKEERVG